MADEASRPVSVADWLADGAGDPAAAPSGAAPDRVPRTNAAVPAEARVAAISEPTRTSANVRRVRGRSATAAGAGAGVAKRRSGQARSWTDWSQAADGGGGGALERRGRRRVRRVRRGSGGGVGEGFVWSSMRQVYPPNLRPS